MSPRDPRFTDRATKAVAGWLAEHPEAQAAVDALAARMRERPGVDMKMHVVDAETEGDGLDAGDLLCVDSLKEPTTAFVIKPDGRTLLVMP